MDHGYLPKPSFPAMQCDSHGWGTGGGTSSHGCESVASEAKSAGPAPWQGHPMMTLHQGGV